MPHRMKDILLEGKVHFDFLITVNRDLLVGKDDIYITLLRLFF